VASECGDVAYQGTCEEAVLTHCTSQGEIQTMDCSDYGDECGYVNHIIGSWCVESNDHHSCGELGFYGYCDGTVINWCNREGVPDSLDCADRGQDCGWVNSATGYYCTD
jgi:hypothetical protein